jgi:hypothetical protein
MTSLHSIEAIVCYPPEDGQGQWNFESIQVSEPKDDDMPRVTG